MSVRPWMVLGLVGVLGGVSWGSVGVTVQFSDANSMVYDNATVAFNTLDIPAFTQEVGTGTVSASAHLGNGSLGITGEASGNATVSVMAWFTDSITITSPSAANGTNGRLAYFVNVAGLVGADSGNAKATFSADALPARGNGQTNITNGGIGSDESDSPGTFGDFLNPSPTDSLGWQSAFVFGQQFQLNVSLTCTATAKNTSTPGHAVFNLDPAVFWDGIIGVYDQNDNLLNTYTLQSFSGADWSQSQPPTAVPEGGTVALLGVGVMGLLRRRK